MTVGSILRGLWLFVRANPATIAGWTILYLALSLAVRAGLAPFYQAQFVAAVAAAQGLPPPFPPVGEFLLVAVLAMLGFLLLVAALWRAVLFPAERHALYLRVGADEARLLGLVGAFVVAAILVGVAIGIGIVVLGLVIGLGTGGSRSTAALVGLMVMLALWLVAIWLSVRLSLVGPLTIARRRIAIGEGWRLARGRFWTLFAVYLLVWLVAAVAIIAVSLPRLAALLAVAQQAGDPAARIEMARLQADQMALSADPGAIVMLLVGAVVGILLHVLLAGVPAVAVAQLLDGGAGRSR